MCAARVIVHELADVQHVLIIKDPLIRTNFDEFEDFYETSEFHCVGTPSQVAVQLHEGIAGLGIDEVVMWPRGMLRSWEPQNVAAQEELVERFATEVIPAMEELS